MITDGGDRLIVEWDPRRSTFECLRIGRPVPTGVPPGEEAHDGATRIFGVFNMLSDSRRFGNELTTRKKLLSEPEGEPPNHQLPVGRGSDMKTVYIIIDKVSTAIMVLLVVYFDIKSK